LARIRRGDPGELRVAGEAPKHERGLLVAGRVDQVIGQQFKRLKSLAETGKPE